MIQAFVISLPDAHSRRAAMKAMLAENISYEIVDAVPGRDLATREREFCIDRYCARFFRDMSLNEIACAVSHKRALERFLDSEAEFGLIFEDDACIEPAALRQLSELIAVRPVTFDLIKLGGYGTRLAPGRVVAQSSTVHLVAVVSPTVCSHAYLVSRSGAEKLVRTILPVREPFDAFLRNVYQHRCAIFETSPWLATTSHNAAESTIGARPAPRRYSPSIPKTLRSAAFRIRYNVLRRLFNLRRFGFSYVTKSGFVRLPSGYNQ
jgi:glycosyl transferase family 25